MHRILCLKTMHLKNGFFFEFLTFLSIFAIIVTRLRETKPMQNLQFFDTDIIFWI